MADDLMDFTDAENKENSAVAGRDENDIPVAPGLVQSPVIVNSILKQSNKDNLIQLYTPVQKPEKGRLKVHFGHDSILQTPNVKLAKKKMENVLPIKEDIQDTIKEDKEKTHVADTGGDVDKGNKAEAVNNDSEEVAKEVCSPVIEQLPIKDDIDSPCSADSGIEECAMEVSISEPTTTEKIDEAADLDFDDILLKSEMLLKSLRGELYTTDSSADDSSQPDQTTSETSEKQVEVGEKSDNQTTEVSTDSDILPSQEPSHCISVKDASDASGSYAESQTKLIDNVEIEIKDNGEKVDELKKEPEIPPSGGDEEPMEVEEAMEVDNEDDDDDEIVFNFGSKDVVESKAKTDEKNNNGTEETNVFCEAVDKKVQDNVNKDIETVDDRTIEEPNVDKTNGNNFEEKNEDFPSEGSCMKVESVESVKGIDNFDDARNEDLDQKRGVDKQGKTAITLHDGETENAQIPSDNDKTKQDPKFGPKAKKKGDDSSDEEFMSADEDMEVDEVKTPAKLSKVETQSQQNVEIKPEQESPERTPPKVGYNLNFDDLDAIDPFSTKKALVNSPDVGKEAVKKKCENVTDEPEDKSDDKTDLRKTESSEHFKSADSSPVKSLPLKAEIPHSPNAVLIDILCKEKTAGDILEEKPDCLLPDDSKQSDNTEILSKDVNSGSETVDIGLGREIKKEIDFDNIDPFKPKTQIVNSPDKTALTKNFDTEIEDPFQASNQIINTPIKAEVNDAVTEINKCLAHEATNDKEKSLVNIQNTEQEKSEEHIVTPQKEKIEDKQLPTASPQIPLTKGAYNLDALDFDDIDPFKPKVQMANSPSGSADLKKPAENDPFKPKKQIMNSPVVNKKSDDAKHDEVDTLKPETETNNSPDLKMNVSENADTLKENTITSQTVVEEKYVTEAKNLETVKEKTEPCKTVFQEADIPQKEETAKEIEADPFKSNSKIQNSPVKTCTRDTRNIFDIDILDNIDPFKPQNQMQNSPVNKSDEKKSELQNLDNAGTISELPNFPSKEETETKSEILDVEFFDDQFKTKSQIQNSPELKGSVNAVEKFKTEISNSSESDTLKNEKVSTDDPSKSKKKLAISPPVKSECSVDPFADLNPFQTKSKVVTTPEKHETANAVKDVKPKSEIDPFKSSNKICNSPALTTIEELPLVTKSRGGNTPTKEDDPFSNQFEIPTTPTNEPTRQESGVGDIFEVQGVTRRGEAGSQAAQFGDIDESQFVSASQVFNDPAAWEMLEKLGGGNSDSGESALSRMSLYVKFDPLVDEAPTNPRRISIRVSQLEKVKEYGLDETLLLLGTPPKKRRQSLCRNTPSEQKSTMSASAQPMVKKAEHVAAPPGAAVDLILDYSPGERKQAEKSSNGEAPAMKLLYDEVSSVDSGNIFQELKYTEEDFKRFQRDNKLALQGLLINKDQELCKEKKQWEKEKAELVKKFQDLKHDRNMLEKAFLGLEQTVYELAALKDTAEKKVEKLETEKAQALEDIQAVETAFSDLHRRYEKAKTIVNSMKKNEETLIKTTENALEKQKKLNEKLHEVEKSAEEKLAANKAEIEKLVHQQDSMQSKCDAQVKILTIKIGNLETAIQRKTEENKELTEICDNLLSKVDK